MTNEEKILLVLEMLGVDSVAKAKKELTELNKALDETKQAADQASGKGGGKGFNAGGLLDVAYALDDLQYGIKGVVNNIPRLAQVLGAGAGLAGAATIAAVAINQLTQRHPEWFEWSEKVKTKLGELTDAIKAEEAAVKRHKEEVDKLSQSNSKRIKDVIDLMQATEQLKIKEEDLGKLRGNIRAGEAQALDPGKAAKEEVGTLKEAWQTSIVDEGLAKDIQDRAKKARLTELQAQTPFDDKFIKNLLGDQFGKQVKRLMDNGEFSMSEDDAVRTVLQDNVGRAKIAYTMQMNQQAGRDVSNLVGGMQTAQTPQEFQANLKNLQRLNPDAALRFNEEIELNKLRAENRKAEERKQAGKEFQDMVDTELIGQRNAALQKSIQQNTIDANIRNAVLGQFDPLTMALFRRQQAGTGRDAQRNLAALESRDVEFYSQALVTQGMDAGRARQAAIESLRGGESSFQQMAAGMGLNVRNVNQGFEASVSIMERLMQENEEQKMKTMMLMQRLNIMDQGNGAPARPQMNRVPR